MWCWRTVAPKARPWRNRFFEMVNYDGTGEDEVAPPLRPPPPPTLPVVSDAAQVLAQANQLMLKKIAHFWKQDNEG